MSHRLTVISLADLTGNMVRPWAEAGCECWCVDVQHKMRKDRTEAVGAGLIHYVWGDMRSWAPPRRPDIGFSFSPCTNLAVSGARDFKKKRWPMLRDGMDLFFAGVQAFQWAGCPWMAENPVGRIAGIYGPAEATFHPWEYAGYLPDIQTDNTSKLTCLWTGGGFIMPDRKPAPEPHRQDCWLASPGEDRANQRSATPMGFARAVFTSNHRAAIAA